MKKIEYIVEEFPILQETVKDLSVEFEFQESSLNLELVHDDSDILMDSLINMMSEKIRSMMSNNFEKLSNILYRIDLDQSKVDEVFSSSTFNDIPIKLTHLIIERQLSKVKTRNYYRSQKNVIE